MAKSYSMIITTEARDYGSFAETQNATPTLDLTRNLPSATLNASSERGSALRSALMRVEAFMSMGQENATDIRQ